MLYSIAKIRASVGSVYSRSIRPSKSGSSKPALKHTILQKINVILPYYDYVCLHLILVHEATARGAPGVFSIGNADEVVVFYESDRVRK